MRICPSCGRYWENTRDICPECCNVKLETNEVYSEDGDDGLPCEKEKQMNTDPATTIQSE